MVYGLWSNYGLWSMELWSKKVRFARYSGSKSTMTSSVFLGIFFVLGNMSAYISLEPQFNADQSFLGNYGLNMYSFRDTVGQSPR